MDKELEEMQFLNLFEIYLESYKIIFSWRRIFSKITLALILPLSFTYLAHMEVSQALSSKIFHDGDQLHRAAAGSARYRKFAAELLLYLLFKAAYFSVFLVLSLLSTAAVVYTIASVYTSRQFTFRTVIAVVPRVWKRLLVTFLSTFVVFFFYNLIAGLVFVMSLLLIVATDARAEVSFALLAICMLIYFVGLLYLSIVWQMASVVSVLEESYGFPAMMKSTALIRGKKWVAVVIFFKLYLSILAVLFLFQYLVIGGQAVTMATRGFYGIFCFLLLSKLILYGLVIQTVLYLVCKSYHHERIDKSALSEHLEVYSGDYVPLKTSDVQLEHFQV